MDAQIYTVAPRKTDSGRKALGARKGVSGGTLLAGLTLFAWLIVLTGIWYWPAGHASITPQPLPHVIRSSWVLGTALALATLLSGHISSTLRPLLLYSPVIAIAFISATMSAEPYTSWRALTLWLVAMSTAAAAGSILTYRQFAWVVAAILALGFSLSLVFAVASPATAWTNAVGGIALRGAFAHKNTLGCFLTVGILWVLFGVQGLPGWKRWLVAAVFGAVLLASRSQTSLMVALVGASYGFWIYFVRGLRLPGWASVFVTAGALAAAAYMAVMGIGLVLTLLGRDPTFTGRTEIWSAYSQFMSGGGLFGTGPGTFSQGSDLSLRIAESLAEKDIQSAHNMYLIYMGEVGPLGIAAIVAVLFYIGCIRPFARGNSNVMPSVLAIGILLAGNFESRDTFITGLSTFFIAACVAADAWRSDQYASAAAQRQAFFLRRVI